MAMIYETIYTKLSRLVPDLGDIEEAKTLKARDFMDLNLDVLSRREGRSGQPGIRIALSHYYRHASGDMIADPDMEIGIYPHMNMAEALTY